MANVAILKTDGIYAHIRMGCTKDEAELRIMNAINVDRYGVGFMTVKGEVSTLIIDVKSIVEISIKD